MEQVKHYAILNMKTQTFFMFSNGSHISDSKESVEFILENTLDNSDQHKIVEVGWTEDDVEEGSSDGPHSAYHDWKQEASSGNQEARE